MGQDLTSDEHGRILWFDVPFDINAVELYFPIKNEAKACIGMRFKIDSTMKIRSLITLPKYFIRDISLIIFIMYRLINCSISKCHDWQENYYNQFTRKALDIFISGTIDESLLTLQKYQSHYKKWTNVIIMQVQTRLHRIHFTNGFLSLYMQKLAIHTKKLLMVFITFITQI